MADYRTKNQIVHGSLREAILTGRLLPGERLNLRQTATELQTSESPMREAIRLLEAEGLVTQVPHVGAMVAEVSRQDVREVAELRNVLEPLAAHLATPHLSADDLQVLEGILQAMKTAVESDNTAAYTELNRQFHMAIYNACPNERLKRWVHQLWDAAVRTQLVFQSIPGHPVRSFADHCKIYEAIKARRALLVYRLMIRHRSQATRASHDLIQKRLTRPNVQEDSRDH